MDTRKLFAMRDPHAARFYVGLSEDPEAHALRAGGEVILEVEVADAPAAQTFVRDQLLFWSLGGRFGGGGWFRLGVTQEALAAVFGTARTYKPSPLKPLAALFEAASAIDKHSEPTSSPGDALESAGGR